MSDTRRMNDIGYATDAYIGELARQGRTQATRRKYQEVLWQLATHIGDRDLQDVTIADIRAFLDRWVNASPSTVALYVSILRGFFQFLVDETVIERSPMATIRRPPRKRPEDLDVVTVSTEDVARMFAACQEWDELLCVSLLAYLGPRRGATARLRRRDVDLERGLIRFQEKGGKVIAKPIPDELAEILRAAEQEGLWIGPDDYVIPNRRPPRSRDRSDKVVYKLVTEIAKRARVRSHVHALRAAFAVRYLDTNPGDLDALQKLLGHSRVETTQVYLRRQDRFRAMERVRSLSWGGSVLPPNRPMPPAGFEPALPPSALPEPLRWKLEELRARSTTAKRRA